MNESIIVLLMNVVATPLLVVLTMAVRNSFDKDKRQEKREDGFIDEMRKRIEILEKEVRELRVELKNRDAEYIELYKKYTTLKAQYEVLQVDHDKLQKEYTELSTELNTLKLDLKLSTGILADKIQKI